MMDRLLLAVLALIVSQPAWATGGATGFGSTLGAGATDSVQTGYTTGPAAQTSVSVWLFINGAAGTNRVFDQTGSSAHSNVQLQPASTTSLSYTAGFTTTDGIFTFPIGTASRWHHVCLTYDNSSTSNKPTVYVDGSSATVTTSTAPVGTAVSSNAKPIFIGNRSAANRVFDGKLADFAYWNGVLLSANECAGLASGSSPLKIRPASLSMYLPLMAIGGTQPDWGPSHVTQTVVGTVAQPGNPVSGYPLQELGK